MTGFDASDTTSSLENGESDRKVREGKRSRFGFHSQLLPVTGLTLLLSFCSAAYGAADRQLVKSYEIENTVYGLCSQGDSLLSAGNYTSARDVLTKAASYDPTSYSVNVHARLAECYRGLKNLPQAISEATSALKYDPTSGEALYTLALSNYDLGNYDQASKYLQRIISVTPDATYQAKAQAKIKDMGAYKSLKDASGLIQSGRDQQATKALENAARYDPSPISARVHGTMAYVLRRNGQAQRAVDEGKRALNYDPSDKATVYVVGIAYGDLGRFDEGIEYLERYIGMEMDPTQRESASNAIKLFKLDRDQLRDPENRSPDYLESGRPRWSQDNRPLKVFIAGGAGVSGYRPGFPSYITRALDTWCRLSGNKLSYVLTKDSDACDIKVVWTAGVLNATSDHPHTRPAGLTELHDENGYIKDALVTIRTVDPFDAKRAIRDSECSTLCLHEMGHSLGLNHSKCISDVMYFRASPRQTGKLTARDTATIAKDYHDYAATNFVPATNAGVIAAAEPEVYKFAPPPSAVMPPKEPDLKNLSPPMFLPPPLRTEKLQPPPMFTPPPLVKKAAPPMFVPPPVKKETKQAAPPMFTPPPVK